MGPTTNKGEEPSVERGPSHTASERPPSGTAEKGGVASARQVPTRRECMHDADEQQPLTTAALERATTDQDDGRAEQGTGGLEPTLSAQTEPQTSRTPTEADANGEDHVRRKAHIQSFDRRAGMHEADERSPRSMAEQKRAAPTEPQTSRTPTEADANGEDHVRRKAHIQFSDRRADMHEADKRSPLSMAEQKRARIDAASKEADEVAATARQPKEENGEPMSARRRQTDNELSFPIQKSDDLKEYLAQPGAPRTLVAFEFSGALRTALWNAGVPAISADIRASEVAGPHYQGDVRDIATLIEWDVVFAVGPSCFQMLRADDKCLPLKMRDGRSFWGIAMVLWCACLPNAKAILIEQPDTIAEDFLRLSNEDDCEVVEIRTTQYGDTDDKFMRFTTRNLEMKRPTEKAPERPGWQPRSQFNYANAEERDRERSSWARFPELCKALAASRPRTDKKPKRLEYAEQIELLADRWREARLPLPWDYANADARPSYRGEREYQRTRGMGDGRDVTQRPLEAEEPLRETHDPARKAGRYPRELSPEEAEVIVVPIQIHGEVTYALAPTDHTKIFGLTKEEVAKTSATQAAQSTTEALPEIEGKAIPIRVGGTDGGTSVVATVTTGKAKGAKARDQTQRKGLGLGRVALWCTMGALFGGTQQATWTQLALSTVQQYTTMTAAENTWAALEAAARESTGARPGKGPLWAPPTEVPRVGGVMTPRDLIAKANLGTEELRHALWNDQGPFSSYLKQWSDSIKPMAMAEVPGELLDKPLDLGAQSLKSMLFAERLPTYKLPWLPRMPNQAPLPPECSTFRPKRAADLLDAEARRRIEQWIEQSQRDLECLERLGPDCDRKDRPPILAIGTESMHHCARERVWDCRNGQQCTMLDYSLPIDTHWDLEYLKEKFKGYADQRLASNVLEGVRLEADVEHQIVLHPNLVSVGEGYESVQKTVRELKAMGFYDFYQDMPFVPMYSIGQGSRVKKIGVRKYRRTSNFSAPHHETRDKAGRKVVAINGASKCYYAPEWLARTKDQRIKRWDEERYAHVKWKDKQQRLAHVYHKFPKEFKATLLDVLRDLWLLLDGSVEVGEQIFVMAEDAGFYFNQFGYAPEEYWKSTLVLGARPSDVTANGEALKPNQPVFIAEKRLGFGSFASSNLAQRFSNALVEWTLQRFDELEAEAEDTPAVAAWRARRRLLEPECRIQRPPKNDRAMPDCNQTRLATIHMYTDDPIMIVVGVDRAIRLLTAWHEVTGRANVTMAGPEKRQIGTHVEWLGVLIMVGIGVVVVPRHKLLRAYGAIERTLEGCITFSEYRALVGLLEHLRFIARLEADKTNALYRPHGMQGENADGPNAIVRPDKLMRSRLQQWLDVLMQCGGATCTMVFTTSTLGRVAHAVYAASSDAAGDGRGTPGLGGYMHGHFWRIALPTHILKIMHITAWEMLAAAINILVAARLARGDAQLAMRTDAALVPYAIVHQKSKSRAVQTIVHCLQQQDRYTNDARRRLTIEHLSGVSNICSDLVSRGLWDELEELFKALHIRGQEVELDAHERRLFEQVLEDVDNGVRTYLDKQSASRHATRHTLIPVEYAHETRPLTAAERGTGKGRSDSTDGDGPTHFKPPWRLHQDARDRGNDTPSRDEHPAVREKFTPPWVRQRIQPEQPPREAHIPGNDERRNACIHEPDRRARMHPTTECPPATPTAIVAATASTNAYLAPTGQHNLTPADAAHVEQLTQRLANDRSPGRIAAPVNEIRDMVVQTALARLDGVNPRTTAKDTLAWKEFTTYAELRHFDPNLCTKWTRSFPERETIKLAGFVLFTAQRIKPRSKSDKIAKPQSVLHRYLALRRVFKLRGEELPDEQQVNAVVKGLVKRFLRREGVAQLRPKRVEPITLDIVHTIVNQATSGHLTIKGKRWCLTDRDCRNVTTWQVANLQIGSRKGEATKLPGDVDENDWFTRASLTAHIAGRTVIDPTDQQLRDMCNTDYFLLAPKTAKCDQFGTCHGTDPIVLPFRDSPLNPARWLRDLERTYPCHGQARVTAPLFAREDGKPYSDTQFSDLINLTIAKAVGPQKARLYSPHSWRVWLATALRVKGASDARIQAFGRWLNPESIKIYARITVQEYTTWQDKIMTVRNFGAAKTTNLPIMDAADALSQWQDLNMEPTPSPTRPTTLLLRGPATCDPLPRPKPKSTRARDTDTRQQPKPRPKPTRARRTKSSQLPVVDYHLPRPITPTAYPANLDDHTMYYERFGRRPPVPRHRS